MIVSHARPPPRISTHTVSRILVLLLRLPSLPARSGEAARPLMTIKETVSVHQRSLRYISGCGVRRALSKRPVFCVTVVRLHALSCTGAAVSTPEAL